MCFRKPKLVEYFIANNNSLLYYVQGKNFVFKDKSTQAAIKLRLQVGNGFWGWPDFHKTNLVMLIRTVAPIL